MSPATGLLAFLALTLALLGTVVWTGLRKRRRTHLTLVLAALGSLTTTIVFAERLGRLYDLEAAGAIYPLHLLIAKLTTAAYLLPVVTGLLTIRRQERIRWHRRCAFLVLGLTVLTAITGSWMLLAAERL